MNDEEERAEVWHVLSDLWTDTDLQPADRAAMARRLAATRYSLGELEHILRDEIAPATDPLRRWIDWMSVRFARPESERVKAEITALRGA